MKIDKEAKQNFIEMGRKEAVETSQNMYGAGKLLSRQHQR